MVLFFTKVRCDLLLMFLPEATAPSADALGSKPREHVRSKKTTKRPPPVTLFLWQVRVGTEANQLTVNKWLLWIWVKKTGTLLNFLWLPLSLTHTHTPTHTHLHLVTHTSGHSKVKTRGQFAVMFTRRLSKRCKHFGVQFHMRKNSSRSVPKWRGKTKTAT